VVVVVAGWSKGFASWAYASMVDAMDALNRCDWTVLDSIFCDNVQYTSPLSRCAGRAAVRARHTELLAAIPDLRLFDLGLVAVEPHRHRAVFMHQQSGTLLHDLHTPVGVVHATGKRFVADTEMAVIFDDEGFVLSVHTRSRALDAA
jgi:hypothetical protein